MDEIERLNEMMEELDYHSSCGEYLGAFLKGALRHVQDLDVALDLTRIWMIHRFGEGDE